MVSEGLVGSRSRKKVPSKSEIDTSGYLLGKKWMWMNFTISLFWHGHSAYGSGVHGQGVPCVFYHDPTLASGHGDQRGHGYGYLHGNFSLV